jgi:hypothetical protein
MVPVIDAIAAASNAFRDQEAILRRVSELPYRKRLKAAL